jgi:cytochrome c biogenesis protein CcdA
METWIHDVMSSGQASITILVAVFFMGFIGVFTCGCNYALFAAVAGYSGTLQPSEKVKPILGSGIAFLAGAIVSMAVIGALFGYAGDWIGSSFGNYWKIAAGLVCIFFGLFSLNFLPFRIPVLKVKKESQKPGIFHAILFGFIVGGLATAFNSCCNPMFPILLAASFVNGSTAWGMLMLSVFALGYAMPLAVGIVGIRFGLGRLSSTVEHIGKTMQYAGGVLLVIMGFYFLLTL